jgi:hypothetical protein
MKIKHFSGEGTVNAVVLGKGSVKVAGKDNFFIKIKVSGNHKDGLKLPANDNTLVAKWLGKVGKFKESDVVSFLSNSFMGVKEENCYYTIMLKGDKWIL